MPDRGKRSSWHAIGGDGMLVSVAFHLLLAIIAVFYISREVMKAKPRTNVDIFELPGNRGDNGEKLLRSQSTSVRTPVSPMKASPRIATRNPSAVSLPDAPQPDIPGFGANLKSDKSAKRFGAPDTGGDRGVGSGPGNKNGLAGMFGGHDLRMPGLRGSFYDAKQRPDGTPSKYAVGDAAEALLNNAFGNEILRRFCGGFGHGSGGWDESFLGKNLFRAPDRLVAGQIFIPHQSADAAPAAYGVADKVKGRRWIAHYKGVVTAPKSGKFRFWGLADDVMVVRWDGRNALDSGWTVLAVAGDCQTGNSAAAENKRIYDSDTSRRAGRSVPFHAGRWIEVTKGRDYPMELAISEVPGGGFGAWLMMEERSASGAGDGKIFLVRFNREPLPDGIRDDTGLEVDMSGKGLVWLARENQAKPH